MLGKNLLKRLFKRSDRLTPVDVLTGYAHWAKNYPPTAHNPLMEIEQQAMLSLLPDNLSGKVCLDLACGSGRYIRLMQDRHAKQVIGLDYSPDMLAQTRQPKLVRAPFLALPFAGDSFDFITCGLAVGHEKNLSRVLAESARVLRPGGTMLYSDFHPFGTLVGWRRTFTADSGAVYELEHHRHLYSNHQQACQTTGLVIDVVLEPFAGPHVPPEVQNIPVVLVIRAVKTGSR